MNTLTLRFGELALALAGAKDRLRVAVAEELGRAAGGAIRDMLSGPVRPLAVRPSYPRRDNWEEDRRWGEPDPWDEDRYEPSRPRYDTDEEPDEEVDHPRPGVPPPLAIGLGLWRWWLTRGSWRGAVTVGVIAGLTAVVGGPVVRAVLTTLAVAAELLTPAALTIETNVSPR